MNWESASDSLLPLEPAFLDFINKPDDEHCKEEHDRTEDREAFSKEVSIDQSPGNQEKHLDIEENKEHRRDVELDRKSRARLSFRLYPAFIRGIFYAALPTSLTQEMASHDYNSRKNGCENDLNQNRCEIGNLHNLANVLNPIFDFKANY